VIWDTKEKTVTVDQGTTPSSSLSFFGRPRGSNGLRLQLLDVGALMPDNYGSCSSWVQCTPIDLHSRHPAIREQDFLLMGEAEQSGKWDVISLSLVLNFVPDPRMRGERLLVFALSRRRI
jgi:25S rRNA (adenine2142-N1)-methyltransferase